MRQPDNSTNFSFDSSFRARVSSRHQRTGFAGGRRILSSVSDPDRCFLCASGFTYDAAGNIINDAIHTYTYDAENRIVTVDGGTAVYNYDAEGRRVAKTAGSTSFEYLFDLGGRAVTELLAGTATTNRTEAYAGGRHLATQNVGLGTSYFIHTDWLGTERARTNIGNSLVEKCTSLPYGDNLSCTATDISPLHFTGKMRDAETGLDEFPARYYSSTQGRWYSPDWASAQVPVPYADLHTPQTLNLYDYVGSDPTNHADPDGHMLWGAGGGYESETSCAGSGCAANQQGQADATQAVQAQNPTTNQIRTELSSLATAYGVPASVVLAVARTESNFNVDAQNDNKNSKGVVTSTDYGVMQVNSKNIGGTATGPDGKSFTITDAIKTDWKANANAGVAIVAQEYKAAVKSQPNGTVESRAQQAYSGYNAGPGGRSRYTQTGSFGGFADRRDRNFLNNYRLETTP